MLVVFLHPFGDADLFRAQLFQKRVFVRRLDPEVQLLVGVVQGINDRPVKHAAELLRRQAQTVPLRPDGLQLLAASQQQLRIVALFRRHAGLLLHAAGQRAGDDAG